MSAKEGLRESGWQPVKPAADDEDDILLSAERHYDEGTFFRSARGGLHHVVPELEPQEDEPAIEGLDDPSVEAGGHDDLGLLDEAFDDPVPSDEPEPVEAELAESEPAGQVEEPVEAEPAERVEVPVEPELAERVEDPPVLGRRADLSMLERLTALRLIYGRGPA